MVTPTSELKKQLIFNQETVQQLHQEKGKLTKMRIGKIKADASEPQPHVVLEVDRMPKNDIRLEINRTHKYNTRSITKRVNYVTTSKMNPTCLKWT